MAKELISIESPSEESEEESTLEEQTEKKPKRTIESEKKVRRLRISHKETYIDMPITDEAFTLVKRLISLMPSATPLFPVQHPVNYLSSVQQTSPVTNVTPVQREPVTSQIPEKPIDDSKVVIENNEIYQKCPKCGSAIKKKKVEEFADALKQKVVCKNKRCGWYKEYLIKM